MEELREYEAGEKAEELLGTTIQITAYANDPQHDKTRFEAEIINPIYQNAVYLDTHDDLNDTPLPQSLVLGADKNGELWLGEYLQDGSIIKVTTDVQVRETGIINLLTDLLRQ